MKRALLVIDYTNDFIADEGALTCGKPGQEIETALAGIAEEFIQNGDLTVFAVDFHKAGDPHHPETALYPPHNVEGTSGRELYGKLRDIYRQNKDHGHVLWMDKTRYSAFAGTNLEILLRERGISELHLTGVCTDICVLHTAVDAYNKGFKLVVHEKAAASFDQEGHSWALRHFKGSLNAEIN
ncbi:isochorismatase family protein [Bacillus mangrovi]|uniref:Isochorismatase family protein n=1 Tax=Metabacillus mangrovi TaxID=1491830 RepID=A0A7X2S7E2_9BACI|nr:isochorismatase family cysteine hydrolase [Metabacillus mangrovi]MTH54655.1 isochorismatase family protein [Metabacillus mangrovi]